MRPAESPPRPQGNPALGWLRCAVWMAPSGAALALLFVLNHFSFRIGFAGILAGLILLAFGSGCYDALIAGPARRIASKSDCWAGVVQHGIVFVFLQVVIVPIVGLMLVFAMYAFGAL